MTIKPTQVIPLAEPVMAGNEWVYIKKCLDTGWVSSAGTFVDRFEEVVAPYLGVPYAVAVVNGTAALHLSLLVAGVKHDDEVMVPTLTFIAPVNAVRYVGASPIFFDCDEKTLCLDVNSVQRFLEEQGERRNDGFTYNKKTNRRIAAVIPVHVFGHPTDMEPLLEVMHQYNIKVIEDATESLGSLYKGKHMGTWGDIGCLSFNGNKIITTGGGGMVVTDNEEWARRARHLSTQAKKDPFWYDHDEVGFNYRLTNIQSAMGVAQMEKLEEYVARKRVIAARYSELLQGIADVQFLTEASWAKSNYWLSAIRVSEADHQLLLQYLNDRIIQARPVWKLIHTLPMYMDCESYKIEYAPRAVSTCINLPCSVSISDEQISQVVEAIKAYFVSKAQ